MISVSVVQSLPMNDYTGSISHISPAEYRNKWQYISHILFYCVIEQILYMFCNINVVHLYILINTYINILTILHQMFS